MPYNADLRCGYGVWEMNTSWIKTCFRDDFGIDFEFKDERDEEFLEKEIDIWATHYIAYTVFNQDKSMKSELGAHHYETIWNFLFEKINAYLEKNKDKLETYRDTDSDIDLLDSQ